MVGDGAPWVSLKVDELCFCPVQVLDYPHAAEHVIAAAKPVFGEGDGLGAMFVETITRMLWEGQIADVIGGWRNVLSRLEAKHSKFSMNCIATTRPTPLACDTTSTARRSYYAEAVPSKARMVTCYRSG